MNTLTIPELNLFNTRRKSPNKKDFHSSRKDLLDKNDHQYLARHLHNSKRDDLNLMNTLNRSGQFQNRYKHIAEDYLQKRSKLPAYYIEPTPYIYNVPSYLYHGSPDRNTAYPCKCETQIPQKDIGQRKLNRNPYVGLKQQSLPGQELKILKQPYLQATFRQKNKPIKQQKFISVISKQNSSKMLQNQFYQQSNYISKDLTHEVNNSKIMQKLKTHQSNDEQEPKIVPMSNKVTLKHQASIQTSILSQNHPKNSHLTSKTRRQNKQSKESVEKILQEQKILIDSLQIEFQKQNQFTIDVQDLESTKNDYIDRSRELLLKLNELADDKREFSFIFKAFNDKKKLNVFSSLQV